MERERTERSRGRRILRGIALAAVCWALLSFAATPLALRLIFPRVSAGDPAALTGMRTAEIPADGYVLRARILDAEEPRGVALLLHGLRADASDMAGAMGFLAERGWTAVALDLTGAGASDGSWARGMQQGLPDGRAALRWIDAQEEWKGLPTVAAGHSAGGWAAAMLSGEARVDGVICVSAFDRPLAMMSHWATRYAGPLAWAEIPFLRLWEAILFGADADASAAQTLISSGKPALVIHGGSDSAVPAALSLYAALPEGAPGVVRLLPGEAAHAGLSLAEAIPPDAVVRLLEAAAGGT